MEVKKSKEANVENSRFSLGLVGLLFISSMILVAFSYKKPAEVQMVASNNSSQSDNEIELEFEEPEQPEEITPPAVDPPELPQEEIVEEENTETEPVVVANVPPPDIPKGPEQPKIEREIVEYPDVEAQFPGGYAAMQQWINDNVQYPQIAIDMGDQGKVFVSFVVEADGSITNIKVIKKVSKELDNEAKRLIRNMPKWDAGEAAGEKVATPCRIPINFTLN